MRCLLAFIILVFLVVVLMPSLFTLVGKLGKKEAARVFKEIKEKENGGDIS